MNGSIGVELVSVLLVEMDCFDHCRDILAAVDVERVARDLDFQVLQDNIEHIALCNIDMEVVSRVHAH